MSGLFILGGKSKFCLIRATYVPSDLDVSCFRIPVKLLPPKAAKTFSESYERPQKALTLSHSERFE